MKSQKKKEESASAIQKKEGEGRRLIRAVQIRETSESEANQIERAIDRLLLEMVRQERALRRKS